MRLQFYIHEFLIEKFVSRMLGTHLLTFQVVRVLLSK
eukprot:UN09577